MDRRHAILTCLLLAALPAAAAMGQTVRLRSDVRVAADEVRLSDVAFVTDLPPAAWDVVLLKLTDVEPSGRVDLGRVALALRRIGINPVPVRFSGAARCTVRRGMPRSPALQPLPPRVAAEPVPVPQQPISPIVAGEKPAATIGERIRRQLAGRLKVPDRDVTVEFSLASLSTIGMAASDETSILSTDPRPLGRRRWRVECIVEGQPQRRYVSAKVLVRREVVTATRALTNGETIRAADVHLAEYADAGKIDVMTDPKVVIGKQVRRAILAGAVVSPASLTSPVLVKRGQNVWVQCGPVRLAVRALDSGRRGDRVALENRQSKLRFWAVVTGPGQAEVAASHSPSRQEVTQ